MALTLPKPFGEFVEEEQRKAFPALSLQLSYHVYVFLRQQRAWTNLRVAEAPLASLPRTAPLVGVNPRTGMEEVVLPLEPHEVVSMHRLSAVFGEVEARAAAAREQGARPEVHTDSVLTAVVDSDATVSFYRFHRSVVPLKSQGDVAAEVEAAEAVALKAAAEKERAELAAAVAREREAVAASKQVAEAAAQGEASV